MLLEQNVNERTGCKDEIACVIKRAAGGTAGEQTVDAECLSAPAIVRLLCCI